MRKLDYSLLDLISEKRELVIKKVSDYIISPSDCWEYQGHSEQSMMDKREGYAYGRTSIKFAGKSRKIYIHRLAYAYHFGVDPELKTVAHRCDNSTCCNPGHLFLATHAENMADMAKKGRASRSSGLTGLRLADEDVASICVMIAEGKTNRQIGLVFGVTDSSIRNIRYGQTHSRVTGIASRKAG